MSHTEHRHIHQQSTQSRSEDQWPSDYYYCDEHSWVEDDRARDTGARRTETEQIFVFNPNMDAKSMSMIRTQFHNRRTSLHGKTIAARISRNETKYRKLQAKTYNFLERPKTWQSFIYHGLVFASVLGSLIISVLNTIDDWDKPAGRVLLYMELAILFWFFAEYCVRLWSAGCRSRYQTWRGRMQFARRPFCIVDIVIIVASVVVLAVDRNVFAATALRGLRFFQILRMIRMDRRGGSFKLLASVVWAHRQELFTTVYIGFLCLIFTSFLIYLVEKKENEKIRSYADALWWGVVTLCTVGYGDTVPKTWMGKLIASLCSLAGISFFALPAGILGSGFALKVQQHQRQKHLIRRRVPAATLIQCLWRCYAADPNSSSSATWKIHMRPVRKPVGMTTSASIIERGGLSRFGRFSTLKRRPEKASTGTYTGVSSATDPEELRRGVSMAHFDCSPVQSKQASLTPQQRDYPQETSLSNELNKSPSGYTPLCNWTFTYEPDKGCEKIETLKEQDECDTDGKVAVDFLQSKPSSLRSRRQCQSREFKYVPTDSIDALETGLHLDRSPACGVRELTETDKVMIRTIRKMKFFVARRKFREALRPYDVKDVIEQYSAGHLDMLTRVKILQLRLDQILGRQGGKPEDTYDSRQSLASRIVKIEHKIDAVELKIDRLMSMYKTDRIRSQNVTNKLQSPVNRLNGNVAQMQNETCARYQSVNVLGPNVTSPDLLSNKFISRSLHDNQMNAQVVHRSSVNSQGVMNVNPRRHSSNESHFPLFYLPSLETRKISGTAGENRIENKEHIDTKSRASNCLIYRSHTIESAPQIGVKLGDQRNASRSKSLPGKLCDTGREIERFDEKGFASSC